MAIIDFDFSYNHIVIKSQIDRSYQYVVLLNNTKEYTLLIVITNNLYLICENSV